MREQFDSLASAGPGADAVRDRMRQRLNRQEPMSRLMLCDRDGVIAVAVDYWAHLDGRLRVIRRMTTTEADHYVMTGEILPRSEA